MNAPSRASRYGMIAGIVILMLCCSASSAGVVMLLRSDTSDTSDPSSPPSPPSPPSPSTNLNEPQAPTTRPEIDESGNMLEGYTGTHIVDPGNVIKGDVIKCRKYAKKHGYVGVGHRTQNHPDASYKDTCFFYGKVDSGFNGNSEDKSHQIGCTDASKTWPDCGTPAALAGYPQGYDEATVSKKIAGASLKDCQTKAKEGGYKGVGYRTGAHPDDAWKNTCFYYNDTSSSFTGNAGDAAHVVACADPTKSWGSC